SMATARKPIAELRIERPPRRFGEANSGKAGASGSLPTAKAGDQARSVLHGYPGKLRCQVKAQFLRLAADRLFAIVPAPHGTEEACLGSLRRRAPPWPSSAWSMAAGPSASASKPRRARCGWKLKATATRLSA